MARNSETKLRCGG